ncbi:DUF7289 family protein [Halobaculum gomorrense]|uniref:Uncharacterized protein n=1 Tax=Halobaculum gomorrense TaxID=43928 RepID=A0A1M5S0V5_9EURY|nr:hypothetical protein [Halobaculum gomorrense]SHH32041.1 hypothetical protein SAMN05443636_2299 [Halobaculum gomorrense]
MTRAQSDAIGFVLVFSIIILTVGTVYATGFGALQDLRSDEQLDNMERAFDVLADNVDEMAHEGAPSRATEIKLTGGTLAVDGATTITMRAVNTSNSADNATVSATTRPISYTHDSSTVALSFGAVLREDGDAAVMRSDPGWAIDDDHALVPLVVTTHSGDTTALGGRSTVLVAGTVRARRLVTDFDTGAGSQARVNLTVTSPRVEAWKRYLESAGLTELEGDTDDGQITYQFEVDRLTVTRTSVAVELRR